MAVLAADGQRGSGDGFGDGMDERGRRADQHVEAYRTGGARAVRPDPSPVPARRRGGRSSSSFRLSACGARAWAPSRSSIAALVVAPV